MVGLALVVDSRIPQLENLDVVSAGERRVRQTYIFVFTRVCAFHCPFRAQQVQSMERLSKWFVCSRDAHSMVLLKGRWARSCVRECLQIDLCSVFVFDFNSHCTIWPLCSWPNDAITTQYYFFFVKCWLVRSVLMNIFFMLTFKLSTRGFSPVFIYLKPIRTLNPVIYVYSCISYILFKVSADFIELF